MEQLKLNFEAGLTERFETLMEVVSAVVAESKYQKKQMAGYLDIRSSDLSRMLGGDLNFPADRLETLMEITGDLRPIYFLIEKYLKQRELDPVQLLLDQEARQARRDREEEQDRRERRQLIELYKAQQADKLRAVK